MLKKFSQKRKSLKNKKLKRNNKNKSVRKQKRKNKNKSKKRLVGGKIQYHDGTASTKFLFSSPIEGEQIVLNQQVSPVSESKKVTFSFLRDENDYLCIRKDQDVFKREKNHKIVNLSVDTSGEGNSQEKEIKYKFDFVTKELSLFNSYVSVDKQISFDVNEDDSLEKKFLDRIIESSNSGPYYVNDDHFKNLDEVKNDDGFGKVEQDSDGDTDRGDSLKKQEFGTRPPPVKPSIFDGLGK